MSDAAGVFVLAGRVLLALYFGAIAGLAHVRQSKAMEGYAGSGGFPLPGIAGWPTGLWLVIGSVSVGFGIWGDVGALMIAAFVVLAAAWFHRFWEVEDQMQKLMQTGFFFRNLVTLALCLVLFALFAGLGSALPFTLTGPLFDL